MTPKEINGWKIHGQIGKGGQAHVFEAVKDEGQPIRAIKIIRSRSIQKRTRFAQEITKHLELSKSTSRNIIPILDHNLEEFSTGQVDGYIVMPKALNTLEQSMPIFKGRVELCLEIIHGILSGVKEAHKIGVIHRDLKPSNILFCDPQLGCPLISDFGICFVKERIGDRITQAYETVGAKFFMAPEQEQGGIVDVTEAADIYALGKLLHYLLTGRHLFRENLSEAFYESELSSDGRLKLILEKILSKSVVLEPSERFRSVDDYIEAVKSIGTLSPSFTNELAPAESKIEKDEARDTKGSETKRDDIHAVYARYTNLLAENKLNLVKLAFDESKRLFKEYWDPLRKAIEKSPQEARRASSELLMNQPKAASLTLAIARFDAIELFDEHKSLLEYILLSSEAQGGYETINEIPHTLAGFLYMLGCSASLHYRSWNLLRKFINTEYEWYYQSRKPNYSLGIGLTCFFHPMAFEGKGSESHDFFRSSMMAPVYEHIFLINTENISELYLQAQLLVSLRAAKEILNGNDIRFWADFGRFDSYRLLPFLQRISQNNDYCRGVSSLFDETPEEWKQNFNPRLDILRSQRFGGPFFWRSLMHYDFEGNY